MREIIFLLGNYLMGDESVIGTICTATGYKHMISICGVNIKQSFSQQQIFKKPVLFKMTKIFCFSAICTECGNWRKTALPAI
jgi:hypothetical protein